MRMSGKITLGKMFVKPYFYIKNGSEEWKIEGKKEGTQVFTLLHAVKLLCRETRQRLEVTQEEMESIAISEDRVEKFKYYLHEKNKKMYAFSKRISTGEFLKKENLVLDNWIESKKSYDAIFIVQPLTKTTISVTIDKTTKKCKNFMFCYSKVFEKRELKFYNHVFSTDNITEEKLLSQIQEKMDTDPELRFKLLFL